MINTAALTLLLQVGQGLPLPGNEEFADQMRDRPARENAVEQPRDPTSQWLVDCLDQLQQDAARAHTQAQIRRNETTGAQRVLANHCLGLAATELGLWGDAQSAFLAAREETPAEELRTRARFGSMAGNAAYQAGDTNTAVALFERAEADADAALEGTIGGLTAIDRARVLVELDRAEEALTALDKAIFLLPETSEAWLLKATLLRRLDRLSDAQSAIQSAIENAPFDPQIGLEAGVIAVLDGRDDAARLSWQSVIDTAPDSTFAETAQDYLTQLGPAPEPETEVGSGA